MLIRYDNILIRNATLEDAKLLKDWWSDGSIMFHAGFPFGINIKLEEIEGFIKKEKDENARTLIIEYDNLPIGEMSYRRLDDNVTEIGIKICNENMQSKGLGYKIMKLFMHELFEGLNYDKIVLDTNLNNIRAQRLYEKLGFRKLRINQDSWKNQLGILQSSVDYEIIREEFLNTYLI